MHSPAEELVYVVDEAGRTVSVVTRREIRARRLPHRCTYIFLFNQRGKLFLHLRTATKDVYPSHWDVAIGGVLAAGEPFATGAKRELAEEVGLDTALEELFPFRYTGEGTIAHAMVYRCVHDGPLTLQPEEIVRGEFVSLAEVNERSERDAFCPDGLAALAEYQQRGFHQIG
jgi:isopentenyldiphosphate isomerase